jgi:hypothetical protein
MTCSNCVYSKNKTRSVPMSGGKKNNNETTNDMNRNIQLGYYPKEYFNDYVMSESYYRPNKEIGFYNSVYLNQNTYKNQGLNEINENFANNTTNYSASNLKPIQYSLHGFNKYSQSRDLGFSEITYTPPANISTFSNKNVNKNNNKKINEGFGSYFMDISYFNPKRDFGYN